VCFVVLKTTSEQECMILTTLYLTGAKNTDSWRARKGDLQHAFPLNVLMVPSSGIAANGEHLMSGEFSHCETVRLGNFEFIINYFGSLILSPEGASIIPDFAWKTKFSSHVCLGSFIPHTRT
jgi:hypothetical protein